MLYTNAPLSLPTRNFLRISRCWRADCQIYYRCRSHHYPCSRSSTDLGTAPPDLTQSVDPNIVVTFDDSGSMGNNYMGDNSPFNNGSWSGVWFCAGIIDPRITDPNDLRSHAMNGVYYNPNVVYSPPIEADGTVMPDADVGLTAVWNDGIQQNRPRSAYTSGTTNFTGVLTRYSSGKVKSDKRWKCPKDGSSPLDDNGGPYYYRLIKWRQHWYIGQR